MLTRCLTHPHPHPHPPPTWRVCHLTIITLSRLHSSLTDLRGHKGVALFHIFMTLQKMLVLNGLSHRRGSCGKSWTCHGILIREVYPEFFISYWCTVGLSRNKRDCILRRQFMFQRKVILQDVPMGHCSHCFTTPNFRWRFAIIHV